jgi:hypothetical protein
MDDGKLNNFTTIIPKIDDGYFKLFVLAFKKAYDTRQKCYGRV